MRRRCSTFGAWVGMVLLCPAALMAQDIGQHALLSGEGSLSLAGAYTGMTEGPTATFYNPAALPFGPDGSLGGSLSINLTNSYSIDGGFQSESGGAELSFEDDTSIPVFIGVTRQFGETPAGFRRHGIGASTLVPTRVNRRFFDGTFGAESASSLLVRLEDATRWYGGGYGYRVSESFGVGLSAFVARRSVRYEETETSVTGTDASVESLLSRSSQVDLTAWLSVVRLGAFWKPNSHLQLGFMFQLPSFKVAASSEVRTLAASLGAGGMGLAQNVFSGDPATPLPWQMSVGLVIRAKNLLVSADISLRGPNGTSATPVQLLGVADEAVSRSLRFFASEYSTRPVVNGAIGIATNLFGSVPLRAGVFSNLSPVREPVPGTRYAPDQVHGFGFSASVGYQADGYDFSVGVLGQFGIGTGLRPASSSLDAGYVRDDVRSQSFHVFIAGAGSTASLLAREIIEEARPP